MTIGKIMQHPAIKAERPDLAYYYQQQQLQQQQHAQQQQRMAPNANNRAPNHSSQTLSTKKVDPGSSVPGKRQDLDIENQPDFQSIKGVFGWTTVDNVNIPYILRGDKQFVSVRIVEMKLLSRYPNSYPDDLGKQAPLTSFFITLNEAKLLNEINQHHCAGEYGKKEFITKDLIVLLSDFIKFYTLVKKTFPDAAQARQQVAQETAGWLQIKNTVTPYVMREKNKYVPLSVIQYAAGLLTNVNVSGLSPTKRECDLLNEACKTAGVEFVFSDTTTRLINVSDILKVSPIDINELPSKNPLKHATYMELPTISNNRSSDKCKASPPPTQGQRPGQPYMFQPGAQLDMMRAQIQGGVIRTDQPGVRFPHYPSFPGGQMLDPRMMDARMAEMYRMHYPGQNRPMMPNGTQNMRPGPMPYNQLLPQINPMMQYYLSMQNGQIARHHGPDNPVGQPGKGSALQSLSNGSDYSTSRSPVTGSNPSPRTRTPSQSSSRPPSGHRQPSESPLGSPLSPTSPSFPSSGLRTSFPVADAMTVPPTSMNSALALQSINSMFLHRFPPPNVPKHIDMSPNNYAQPFSMDTLGLPNQYVNVQTVTGMPTIHSPPLGQPSVEQSANQELPGLFSPTGTNHLAPKQREHVVAVRETYVPPTSVQVGASFNSKSGHAEKSAKLDSSTVTSVTPEKAEKVVPVTTDLGSPVPAPRNQPLPTTISVAKPQAPLMNSISGNWLNNKSISCLYLDEGEGRKGPFCLVEAVCKLYFNGCSVNEFLFALENVLNVPLLTCNDSEEKAFIQYYSLPVLTLKCNKMIRFDDLEKYFPQLTYMFPSKEALAQTEGGIPSPGLTDDTPLSNGGLTTEEIEASMPTTVTQMKSKTREKRPGDEAENVSSPKQPRVAGTDDVADYYDDAVIVLD